MHLHIAKKNISVAPRNCIHCVVHFYKFVILELRRAPAHLVLGLPAGFGTFGPACSYF